MLDAVEAAPAGSLADRIDASHWRIELPEVDAGRLADARWPAFLAADEVLVERMTKQGRRTFDARAAVIRIDVIASPETPSEAAAVPCAILDLVVRQVTPSVRPDDVLSGLRVVADLEPPVAAAGDPAGAGHADRAGRDRGSVGRGPRRGSHR